MYILQLRRLLYSALNTSSFVGPVILELFSGLNKVTLGSVILRGSRNMMNVSSVVMFSLSKYIE